MLVLKRKDGQWIEITHRLSGDTLRFRVYDIVYDRFVRGKATIAFDDPDFHFAIERPERVTQPAHA